MAAKRSTTSCETRGSRKVGAAAYKGGESADLRLLARDAALAALKRLADLSRSEDERVALAATQELLNRAFGKASPVGAEEASPAQPLIIKIMKFGDADNTNDHGGGQS